MEFTFENTLRLIFHCELGFAAVARSSITCEHSFAILKETVRNLLTDHDDCRQGFVAQSGEMAAANVQTKHC
jgi:hypothetical protein